jgi:hypothetical protein
MLTQNQGFEEKIGVRLPDGTRHMAVVRVGALDSDEDVLKRISTRVGTLFNVTGTKYLVTCQDPFRLEKVIGDEEVPADSGVIAAPAAKVSAGPQIGETWRPKDPRRKASFIVLAVEEGHVVTNDGRRIQLTRFKRYERVG